jgi:hypothetical protein
MSWEWELTSQSKTISEYSHITVLAMATACPSKSTELKETSGCSLLGSAYKSGHRSYILLYNAQSQNNAQGFKFVANPVKYQHIPWALTAQLHNYAKITGSSILNHKMCFIYNHRIHCGHQSSVRLNQTKSGGQSAVLCFSMCFLGLPDPHDEDTTTVRRASNYLQATLRYVPQDLNLHECRCKHVQFHVCSVLRNLTTHKD